MHLPDIMSWNPLGQAVQMDGWEMQASEKFAFFHLFIHFCLASTAIFHVHQLCHC